MPTKFELFPFESGQRVVLRKQHPCGSREWDIVRAGADITVKCSKCGHAVIMKRRVFERAVISIFNEEAGHE